MSPWQTEKSSMQDSFELRSSWTVQKRFSGVKDHEGTSTECTRFHSKFRGLKNLKSYHLETHLSRQKFLYFKYMNPARNIFAGLKPIELHLVIYHRLNMLIKQWRFHYLCPISMHQFQLKEFKWQHPSAAPLSSEVCEDEEEDLGKTDSKIDELWSSCAECFPAEIAN